MIQRVTEPASTNPMTTDWQNLLNKLMAATGGFVFIDFNETRRYLFDIIRLVFIEK